MLMDKNKNKKVKVPKSPELMIFVLVHSTKVKRKTRKIQFIPLPIA